MDPIAALELIASGERSEVLLPLTYGYLSYARDDLMARSAICLSCRLA